MNLDVGGWRRGETGEGPQLKNLFPWAAQLVCSQEMLAGVGGWEDEVS